MTDRLLIRPAEAADLTEVAALAAKLVALHHELDADGPGQANLPPTGTLREQFLRRKRLLEATGKMPSTGLGCALMIPLCLALMAGVSLGIKRWSNSKTSSSSLTSSSSDDQRRWIGLPPVLVDLGGDGVEDLVGYNLGTDDQLFLGAFDGATLATKWMLGPFGKWGGGPGVHLVARGDRVIAISGSVARIVDVKAGEAVTTLALSDKVDSTCVPEGSLNAAWLSVGDGNHVLIDAATGTVKRESRPADCAGVRATGRLNLKTADGFRYTVSSGDLKVPGFSAGSSGTTFVQDGSHTVVVGSKSPGTPFPILVGGTTAPPPRPNLDDNKRVLRDLERMGKTKRVSAEQITTGGGAFLVAWQKRLGPDGPESEARQASSPLAAHVPGGLVTVYMVGDVTHLVRVEAATGQVLWDVSVPGKNVIWEGVSGSASRVYLFDNSVLMVFDANTGAEAGLFGQRFWLRD